MSQMRLGSKSSDSFICILNDAYEVIKTDYTNIMKKIVISKKSKVMLGDRIWCTENPIGQCIQKYKYKKVHPDIQPKFQAKVFSNSEWKYRSRVTGNVYGVYGYHPSK